jgi:acetyl esterase/lipase
MKLNAYNKVLSFLAVVALIVSLVGCSSNTPDTSGNGNDAPGLSATPAPAETPNETPPVATGTPEETPSGTTETEGGEESPEPAVPAADWAEENGVILYDLSYGEAERNTYDLYIPADASKEAEVGIILFIHGGSWTTGSKEDMAPECKRYAKAGYITASMNYTYAGGSAENTAYKMLDEIQSCVAAVKEELTGKGYNVTKMAISGYSAGGHLAALYAYSRADVSALPVVLLVDFVGPADFHTDSWLPGLGASMTSLLTGQKITNDQMNSGDAEGLINSISPVHFVTGISCASLLVYGGQDQLIGQAHHEKLAAALDEAGVDYTLIVFPNSGHSLENDPDKFEEYISTAMSYLKEYFGY